MASVGGTGSGVGGWALGRATHKLPVERINSVYTCCRAQILVGQGEGEKEGEFIQTEKAMGGSRNFLGVAKGTHIMSQNPSPLS